MANSPVGNKAVNTITNKITGQDTSKAAAKSASMSLKKLMKDATGLRSKFRDLSIIGTAVTRVFQAIGKGASAVSTSASDMELANRRLDFAIQKAGITTVRAKETMLDYADTLAQTTRFTAAAMIESQQLFITMGGLGVNNAMKATKAVADFTEEYKGGNGLVELTRLAARTLRAGGADAGEFGVKMEVSATKMEKFNTLITQINDMAAGASTQIAKSGAGAWAIFANRVGLAVSNIGTIILQSRELQAVIKLVTNEINAMGLGISDINKLPKELRQKFETAFHGIRTVVVNLIFAVLNLLPLVLTGIGIVFEGIRAVIEVAGTAIKGLGQAIQSIPWIPAFKTAGKAVEQLGQTFQVLDETLDDAIGSNKSLAWTARNGVESLNFMTKAGASLKWELDHGVISADKLNATLDELAKTSTHLGGVQTTARKSLGQTTKSLVTQATQVDGLRNSFNALFQDLLDPKMLDREAVKLLGDRVRDQLVGQFSDLSLGSLFSFDIEQFNETTGVKEIVEQLGILGQLTDIAASPFRAVGEEIANATLQVDEFGVRSSLVASAMTDAFRPVGQVLGAIFSIPMKVIGQLLDATLGWLGRLLTQALVSIGIIDATETAATVKQTAQALIASKIVAANAIATAQGLALAWAVPASLAAIATLGGALAFGAAVVGTVGGVVGAISAINATVGVASTATAAAAEGGVTTRPMLLGDNPGGQEAIIPLGSDRGQRLLSKALGGGSGGVRVDNLNVSVEGGSSDAEQLATLIGEKVAESLEGLASLGGLGI